jgi:methionine sulfoxide reductase heme-binding subunit
VASILVSRWTKAGAFLVCLLPLAALGRRAWKQDLGANPIELITHPTGDWAMRFLLITLAVTPLSKVLSMPLFTLFRRMLGLFAFFYGCLHFLTYLWLDKFFDLSEISGDIGKRPFITIGFTSLMLMVPLAATSTAGWIKRLGPRRWEWLRPGVNVSGDGETGVLSEISYSALCRIDGMGGSVNRRMVSALARGFTPDGCSHHSSRNVRFFRFSAPRSLPNVVWGTSRACAPMASLPASVQTNLSPDFDINPEVLSLQRPDRRGAA